MRKPGKNLSHKLSVIREVTTFFQLLICQISAAGCLGVKNSTACITGKESSYVKPFQQSSFRVVQWYSQRRVRCWRKAPQPSFWQRGNSFDFKLPKSLFGRKAILILNERVSKINIHSVNKLTKYKVSNWDHIISDSFFQVHFVNFDSACHHAPWNFTLLVRECQYYIFLPSKYAFLLYIGLTICLLIG